MNRIFYKTVINHSVFIQSFFDHLSADNRSWDVQIDSIDGEENKPAKKHTGHLNLVKNRTFYP